MMETQPRDPENLRALIELGVRPVDDPPTIGGFEVLEELGQGGMGVVYLARRLDDDQLVALKILDPALAERPEFAARFEQEARVTARLNHPGIVKTYDFGRSDDLYFIVMEYVRGQNLRQWMNGQPWEVWRIKEIVRSVAHILEAAHAAGVIHRDIKPENILVDPQGNLKIADFGLAKLIAGPDLSLTGSMSAVGTILYLAPEQLEGSGELGPHTDVYSLGVLAYELLTGRFPVGKFGAPSQEGASDEDMDDIVLRCLERDPARRYATAGEFLHALTRIKPPPRRWYDRGHLVALAALGGVALATFVVSLAMGSLPPWHFQLVDGELQRVHVTKRLGSVGNPDGILEYPACVDAYRQALTCEDIGHPLSMDVHDNLSRVDSRWRELPTDERRPDLLVEYCVAAAALMPRSDDCIDSPPTQ